LPEEKRLRLKACNHIEIDNMPDITFFGNTMLDYEDSAFYNDITP